MSARANMGYVDANRRGMAKSPTDYDLAWNDGWRPGYGISADEFIFDYKLRKQYWRNVASGNKENESYYKGEDDKNWRYRWRPQHRRDYHSGTGKKGRRVR